MSFKWLDDDSLNPAMNMAQTTGQHGNKDGMIYQPSAARSASSCKVISSDVVSLKPDVNMAKKTGLWQKGYGKKDGMTFYIMKSLHDQ